MHNPPLHEQVRQLRERRGLSASELAKRADVAVNTVLNMERGRNVSLESFLSVLSELGHEVRITRLRLPKVANKLKATTEAPPA